MISSICFMAAIVGIIIEGVLILIQYLKVMGELAAIVASLPSFIYGIGFVTFPIASIATFISTNIGLISIIQMLILISSLLPLIGCIFIELFIEGTVLTTIISAGTGLSACAAATPCIGPMVGPILGLTTILNLKAVISLCACMVVAVNITMGLVTVTGLLISMLIALSLIFFIVFEVCCITVNEICTLTITAGAGVGCCFSMLVVFFIVTVAYGFAMVLALCVPCPGWFVAIPVSVIYFVCMLSVMTCFPPAALPFICIALLSILICAGAMFIVLLVCIFGSMLGSFICVTVVMGSIMVLSSVFSCMLFICLECVIWNIGISVFGVIIVISLAMIGPILCMVQIITCILGLTIAPMFLLALLVIVVIVLIGYAIVQRVFGG